MSKTKDIKAHSQLIFCPACGALSYGRRKTDQELLKGEKIVDIFCKSCGCDLTIAAKRYAEAIKKINETVNTIKKEGTEAAKEIKGEESISELS